MKNFETLISLLIVGSEKSLVEIGSTSLDFRTIFSKNGISTLTTAQPYIPTADESYTTMRSLPGFIQAGESPENVKAWFEEKCERNGGPGAFESAMKFPEFMSQCMKSVVNVTELQMELEIASQRENFGTVFKKYCKKVPEMEKCLMNMKSMVAPCFDPTENEGLEINDKMTAAVLEYICDSDGERISDFVVTGGMQCIQSMRAPVLICANDNLGQFTSLDISSHPLMNLGPEKCSNLEKFKTCTIRGLEKCGSPTTDFFEGLFSSVRRVTPCEELASSQGAITQKPTEASENVGQEPKPVESYVTLEELTRKTLVEQIEAAEAQVRAANAQEQAAFAQEQAARVVEQVGKIWLGRKSY